MGQRDLRSRWSIGDVLDRTDLAALLDELAEPSGRSGPGRKWHCPVADHDDHRASVTMFRDRHGHERWRCWSADHRGDAVDLVASVRHCDRLDAIDWLATRAGLIPDRPLPPIPIKRTRPTVAAVEPSPMVERYVRVCESVLRGPQGREVREWLHARGLNDDTIIANRLGADPGRRVMRRDRGLPYGAGLAAVMPALDPTGRAAYVQVRYLDPDSTGRKYDNPSAAIAPHPRLAYPVPNGERCSTLLVCEGLPDALTASQAGFRAVALLGAQTPDESVAARLANYAANHGLAIAIAADPDEAGRRLTATLAELLDQQQVDARSITPPDGLDLNAWALADSTWDQTIDECLRRASLTASADRPELDGVDL
ncbi:MAG: hypothetical protein B7C54_11760 [Acidimicrobiales bacterium mtb01]|nr:toprim domain-containing protein [Actinomycetota bacterium]TEX45722.1 MAG: hypothetical protein B7C54_11760 [Acidimicrobiales bacterium mtb01]